MKKKLFQIFMILSGILFIVVNTNACFWAFYQPEVPQKPMN